MPILLKEKLNTDKKVIGTRNLYKMLKKATFKSLTEKQYIKQSSVQKFFL